MQPIYLRHVLVNEYHIGSQVFEHGERMLHASRPGAFVIAVRAFKTGTKNFKFIAVILFFLDRSV
jgi:hypothetical protein